MTDSSSADPTTAPKPFPAKARVILHGLKAAEFNDKIGIIQAGTLNDEGRQQVLVEELNKNVALKLSNLKYQEREIESLSIKELKSILRHREAVLKFQGMDKTDLQDKLKDLTTSPLEIAEWLAHANAPTGASSSNAAEGNASSNDMASSTTASGGGDMNDLENMNPETLRQQAQMMRSMPPATVRAMNPQLAHMTDAQIQQAAAQMEMMASNPHMMAQAKKQMKNMTPAQKKQYDKMMAQQKGGRPNASGANANAAPQNPQDMLANMSPEQLRQQAQMMKSMPPDTIRSMNPQLAHMTDAQIQQAATQMEMMASNPELMKMANEQMKNMSPEQMQEMMKGGAGAGGDRMNPMMMPGAGGNQKQSGGGGTGTDMANMDPAKMLETMDTAQIRQMMNMLKSNPEMLDNLSAQSGMPKEGLQKAMDMFSGMSDDQLESSLKSMAKMQKVTAGFTNAWKSVDKVVGGKLKILLMVGTLCCFVLVVLYFLGGDDASSKAAAAGLKEAAKTMQDNTPLASPQETGTAEDEFGDEF